jgi:hypothetical protein
LPLLHFEQKWRRAPKNGKVRKPKIRPIRYACRKDSYIYKHYRELLSVHYERVLRERSINDCVLAYRKIPESYRGSKHKTNVEFARDAFQVVRDLGDCTAVAIDISDFFGSISHHQIKAVWENLLGVERLPDDHFRVFESITKYKFVGRDDAYLALGYSAKDANGNILYAVDPKTIPMQICTMDRYRKLIVGGRIVKKNDKPYGIPQGLPISDLLANSYLLDFDQEMVRYAEARGGKYFRYSDDILFVLPGDGRAARGASKFAQNRIAEHGSELRINAEKTEIACFTRTASGQSCYNLKAIDGSTIRCRTEANEGLSYLGFRFDGKSVYLRNSTIANLRGKIARSARAIAHAHVNRYEGKTLKYLLDNAPINDFRQKFLHVAEFDEAVAKAEASGESPFNVMTFWSYVTRSHRTFASWNPKFFAQLRSLRTYLPNKLDQEIISSYQKRSNRQQFKAAEKVGADDQKF